MFVNKNKTYAFFLSLAMVVISWSIIFINVVLRITTLFQFGINTIDAVGFTLVTILLTVYTFIILFKFSNNAYFPFVLIMLHLSTLSGTAIIVMYLIADLIILLLLNTGQNIQVNGKGANKHVFTTFSSCQPNNEKTYNNPFEANRASRIPDPNVIDVEYTTKN